MASLLAEIWRFVRSRKKPWLAPVLIALLFLGAIIVLAQGSVIAPFIYSLF